MLKRLITAMFGREPNIDESKPLHLEIKRIETKDSGVKFIYVAPVKYTQMKFTKIRQCINAYFVGSGH